MKAYRTHLTVTDPNQVVLTALPFRAGQRVEVILLASEEEKSEEVGKQYDLLSQTQATSAARDLDEDVFSKEVAAYRGGG
jgi:hypothetical protein